MSLSLASKEAGPNSTESLTSPFLPLLDKGAAFLSLMHSVTRSPVLQRGLRVAGALAIIAASYIPILGQNNTHAENQLFPNPAPQSVSIYPSYKTQFIKIAGNELVGVVNLPGETTQRIVKEIEDPATGEKRLKQIGTAPFRLSDAGISPDDPKTILGVGLDSSTGKGKIAITSNEGQSWQYLSVNQIPLLGRGPLLKAEIIRPSRVVIAQGDPLASNYPNYFLNFDLISKTVTDLPACVGCKGGGIYGGLPASFLYLLDNTPYGYKSADPRADYTRLLFTSNAIISSGVITGSIGYVQGDPRQWNDQQGLNNVVSFNNFARVPGNPKLASGIVSHDRYSRSGNDFTFVSNAIYYPASYPPEPSPDISMASNDIIMLIPDATTDDIYAGLAVQYLAAPNWFDSMAAYIETINNHTKLPTNGVWIQPENDHVVQIKDMGLSVKGGNKLLQAALSKSKWVDDPANQTSNLVFEQGQLMTFDVTGGINPQRQWQGVNLYVDNNTYKVYLPVVEKNNSN